MAFDITKQEIIKQAIALNTLWKQTREKKYRDEELRLRRIALDLEATVIPTAGVTRIIAGTNVSISPSGGTGDVTINAVSVGTETTSNVLIDGGTFTAPNNALIDAGGFV